MDYFALDVGEADVAAGVAEGEFFVVEAEEGEDGGVEVVDVDGVFNGFVAVVVGGAVGEAWFGAAAGHPHGEAFGVVVASVGASAVWGAAEFSAPDDEGVIEEPVGVEVVEEGGDGLIGGPTILAEFFGEILVLIPAGVADFDVADAGGGEASGDEALAAEGIGGGLIDAVEVEGGWGFFGEIEDVGEFGLHFEGEFVGLDDAFDFLVGGFLGEELVVHGLDEIELLALGGWGEDGVAEIGDGVGGGGVFAFLGADAGALVDGGEEGVAVALGAELDWGGDGDVAGEVFVFGAETVEGPGAEGGADELGGAGVELVEGLGVVGDIGVEAVEEAEAIGLLGEVGEEFGDPVAGVAVLSELEGGAEEFGA